MVMNETRHILYLALAFLLMTACANQREQEHTIIPTETEEGYVLELPIAVSNVAQGTVVRATQDGVVLRATGTEQGDHYNTVYSDVLNENKIDKLNLFIFDASDNLIKAYSDTDIIKSNTEVTTDGSYKGKVKVPKADVSKIENKSVKIIAVANPKEDIIAGVSNLSQLREKFEVYADLNKKEEAQTNFLMDGMLELSNINWGANLSYAIPNPIELKRALAKIRVRIQEIAVKDFQNGVETPYDVVNTSNGAPDISVKLMRYSNATSLLAGKPYAPQWQTETDYRSMPQRDYGATGLGNRTGKFYGSYPFYAGESTWIDPATKKVNPKDETYLMVRIKLIPKNHKPEDTGRYYYYRLPINYRKTMDGVPEERLHKVERNYLYDVLTSIEQLGSLDEGTPVEVKSHIALQPWPVADAVDGTIVQAHYLVVKEHTPTMANVSEYNIEYVSSLPVKTEITEVFYEYYDQRGDYYKVVFDTNQNTYKFYWYGLNGGTTLKEMTVQEIEHQGLTKPHPTAAADGSKVEASTNYIKDGFIKVTHAVPQNFVPFQIKFKVTQIDEGNDKPLSDSVHVTQYPPLFVTGRKSPGFAGGTSKVVSGYSTNDYVDFRHYSTLGSPGRYAELGDEEPQRNDVFNRITTKVPGKIDLGGGQTLDYSVGNPFDETTQMTVKEDWAQNIVSPEFIIASQHGLANILTPQYQKNMPDLSQQNSHEIHYDRNFMGNYGPFSTYFDNLTPYKMTKTKSGKTQQTFVKTYKTAGDRCYNYFEGEYGMDGKYGEYYWDRDTKDYQWRVIEKTFKYKGRWRVPTIAEVRLIDAIQDDPNSVTKRLMYGRSYWTAKTGTAYGFTSNTVLTGNDVYQDFNDYRHYRVSPVRCIFDTYMHDDDKGLSK